MDQHRPLDGDLWKWFENRRANEINRKHLPDPIIGVFFLVNEPQPDEPEAMEASSLELTVCRLDITLGFAVIRLVGTGLGPTEELTRPKSSSDGNWLIFEEGLERLKKKI